MGLKENRKAIRSLRVGIVPTTHVLFLTVGVNSFKSLLDTELSKFKENKQTPFIINDEWGSGKTNLLNYMKEYVLKKKTAVMYVRLDGRSTAANHPQRYYHKLICGLRMPGIKGTGLPCLLRSLLESKERQLKALNWARSHSYYSDVAKGFNFIFDGDFQSGAKILLGGDLSWGDYNYFKNKAINRIVELGNLINVIGYTGIMIQFDEVETISQLWNVVSRRGAYRTFYSFLTSINIWPVFASTQKFYSLIISDYYSGILDKDWMAKKFAGSLLKIKIIHPPLINNDISRRLSNKICKLYNSVYEFEKQHDFNQIIDHWSRMPFKNYRRLIRLAIDYLDRSRPVPNNTRETL